LVSGGFGTIATAFRRGRGTMWTLLPRLSGLKQLGVFYNDLEIHYGEMNYLLYRMEGRKNENHLLSSTKTRCLDKAEEADAQWKGCEELQGLNKPEMIVWDLEGKLVTRRPKLLVSEPATQT
jgi:hypothetical protein